jgi:hypothetical protein
MSSKWTRILSGGVCAGLVFNVGGITSAWLMDLPEAFARFGVEPTASVGLLHLGLRFGLGFASVLLYAGMRGGLGPGAGTALRAAIPVWFIGYVPGSAVLNELGVLGDGQLFFAILWGVAETVAAVVLGAGLYEIAARRSGHGS